ncbi:MAG: hypothetical protein J0H09_23580 [Burkholderiales bacterium]|nr:hypothetical protein [Burkholderiales bacterium]
MDLDALIGCLGSSACVVTQTTSGLIIGMLLFLVAVGLTLIFITHDLRVAGEVADQVVVMNRGSIVERGAPEQVLGAPRHAYTRQLVEAVAGATFIGTLAADDAAAGLQPQGA